MITLGELQSIKWREGKIEEYDVIDILNKNSKYSIAGYEDKFILNEGSETPTKEDIELAIAEKKKEYQNTKYVLERSLEYPSIEELVVALYDEEDKASIIERRNAVKAKYPNPE